MKNIQFGFCLPIFAWPGAALFRTPAWGRLDAQRCMQLGVLAEQLGYGSLWVADHLMLGAEEAILEGWTTLAALAGMSEAQGGRAKLGIIHYNNVFRHPAFTAKMVSTLDQISNGRMIHCVDFGNNSREYLAYGVLPESSDFDFCWPMSIPLVSSTVASGAGLSGLSARDRSRSSRSSNSSRTSRSRVMSPRWRSSA